MNRGERGLLDTADIGESGAPRAEEGEMESGGGTFLLAPPTGGEDRSPAGEAAPAGDRTGLAGLLEAPVGDGGPPGAASSLVRLHGDPGDAAGAETALLAGDGVPPDAASSLVRRGGDPGDAAAAEAALLAGD